MGFFSKSFLFLFTFMLTSLSLVHAGPYEFYLQNQLKDKKLQTLTQTVQEYRFNQLIDHHNPSLGNFSQRYYIDETYGKSNNAPVFFYICGEGTCSKNSLNGAIRTYAQKYKAKLVALEHRYYGESLPVYSLSTHAMRYLSTDAALEDLAYFQNDISSAKNWTGTWIAFGGSYPGSLSAYYRLKHPELVAGALASSAPVMAKENFIEFDAHVTQVAGPICAKQMNEVVSEIESVLNQQERFYSIKALFDAAEVLSPVDFLYLIADIGAGAIQYGDRDSFCEALASNSGPLAGYASYVKDELKRLELTAVQLTVQGLMSEDPKDYEGYFVGIRQWYYQSCTEYGYWQNANPDSSLSTRSSLINLEYHRQVCQRLFGFNQPANTELLNQTYYFPLMSNLASQIYFTNGEQDPWSTLSMAERNGNASNSQLTYQLIKGAAHCDDLHTPTLNDSQSLTKARQIMDDLLEKWLRNS